MKGPKGPQAAAIPAASPLLPGSGCRHGFWPPPSRRRSDPHIDRRRYFGTSTTWYLQYHFTWDCPCQSRMMISFQFGQREGDHLLPLSARRNGRALRTPPPEAVAYLLRVIRGGCLRVTPITKGDRSSVSHLLDRHQLLPTVVSDRPVDR